MGSAHLPVKLHKDILDIRNSSMEVCNMINTDPMFSNTDNDMDTCVGKNADNIP
jgi:hypothetical protein